MSPDTHIVSEKGDCDKIYGERVNFTEKENILNKVKEIILLSIFDSFFIPISSTVSRLTFFLHLSDLRESKLK